MSVNINYQGYVYDENDNKINCYYQVFCPSISKWSEVRETDNFQYNINYGDGDIYGQNTVIEIGEAVVVVFWDGDENRDSSQERFSAAVIKYDGNSSNILNVQLIKSGEPGCDFNIDTDFSTHEEVIAESKATLLYEWEYDSAKLFQSDEYNGEKIFGFLEIDIDEFDFGDGYGENSFQGYDNGGVYEIFHYVENSYGVSSECVYSISVHNIEPQMEISVSRENPSVGDMIAIEFSSVDTDGVIESVEYFFNNISLGSSSEDYFSTDVTVESKGDNLISCKIYWNDGISDIVSDVKKTIFVAPRVPDLSIYSEELTAKSGDYKAVLSIKDEDSTIVGMTWKIYYLAEQDGLPYPYFNCSNTAGLKYKEIYFEENKSRTYMLMSFSVKGKYKISVTAIDEYDNEYEVYSEIDVESICIDECKEIDCTQEVNDAVAAISIKYLDEIKRLQQIVVVSGSKSPDGITAELQTDIGAKISNSSLSGDIKTGISGSTSSAAISGNMSSSISGKIV